MIFIGIYLGIGLGLCLDDILNVGFPSEWVQWLDFFLCPFLWPVAIYRRLT